jgi:hypothetical protein
MMEAPNTDPMNGLTKQRIQTPESIFYLHPKMHIKIQLYHI